MKTLVAYYSRHGHTGKVGKKIAKILRADVEEVIDKKDREHLISWDKSSFDEELRTSTKIIPTKYDAGDYDLVVIGTPIWDGISPPIKEYFSKNKFKKVAFFITFSAAAEDAAYQMERLSRKPVAVLELQDRQIDNKEVKKKIKEFCREIKRKVR